MIRRLGRLRLGDRGSSAIELVVLAPVLLVLIWLTIQYAMYFQARQVALAAAQIGARTAREDADELPDWQTLAINDAKSYYAGLGTKVLGNGITVTATISGSNVQVLVTGQVPSLLFGLPLKINETSGGAIECFRPELDGGEQC